MKLLTKELEKKLPALYSQEEVEDPMVRAHFFDPCGAANWWITEGEQFDEDYLMFGLCDLGLGCPELGYASMSELQSVKGRMGIGIERDRYWTPVHLSEVREKMMKIRGGVEREAS